MLIHVSSMIMRRLAQLFFFVRRAFVCVIQLINRSIQSDSFKTVSTIGRLPADRVSDCLKCSALCVCLRLSASASVYVVRLYASVCVCTRPSSSVFVCLRVYASVCVRLRSYSSASVCIRLRYSTLRVIQLINRSIQSDSFKIVRASGRPAGRSGQSPIV